MEYSKTILILDKLERGTIQTCLETNHYNRTLKLLNSSVKNWESICEILENDDNIIVLGKFTEYNLFRMCLPYYKEVAERLFALIKQKKHLIFIYKDNILGNFSYFQSVELPQSIFEVDEKDDYFRYHEKDLNEWLNNNDTDETEVSYIKKVRELIENIKSNLNVLPYEKLLDIEISGQNFIENITQGLLFRIYIPNDRIWSNEFDKFITLFRDYASNIAKKELKITQNRTDMGVVCSLYSIDTSLNDSDVNILYKDFSIFMDMCSSNPQEAENILKKFKFSEIEKSKILQKYIKESQRLLLDIKHEREIKLITIKHRLESELQEFEINRSLIDYVDSKLPSSNFSGNFGFLPQVIHNQTININPQIINKVDGIVCQELNGNIQFSTEEEEIMKLIEKYATDFAESSQLQSSLFELKDSATPNDKKRTALQKITGFLGKVGEKVGEVGISLLTKYLEQKLGM